MAVCVGAMMVGSIHTTVNKGEHVKRGQEFGYFAFGRYSRTENLIFSSWHFLFRWIYYCLTFWEGSRWVGWRPLAQRPFLPGNPRSRPNGNWLQPPCSFWYSNLLRISCLLAFCLLFRWIPINRTFFFRFASKYIYICIQLTYPYDCGPGFDDALWTEIVHMIYYCFQTCNFHHC